MGFTYNITARAKSWWFRGLVMMCKTFASRVGEVCPIRHLEVSVLVATPTIAVGGSFQFWSNIVIHVFLQTLDTLDTDGVEDPRGRVLLTQIQADIRHIAGYTVIDS